MSHSSCTCAFAKELQIHRFKLLSRTEQTISPCVKILASPWNVANAAITAKSYSSKIKNAPFTTLRSLNLKPPKAVFLCLPVFPPLSIDTYSVPSGFHRHSRLRPTYFSQLRFKAVRRLHEKIHLPYHR